jgi:hypothetical protein
VEKPNHHDTWRVRESAAVAELENLSGISELLEVHHSSAEARLLDIAAAASGLDEMMEDMPDYMTAVTQLESRCVWIRDALVELVQIH